MSKLPSDGTDKGKLNDEITVLAITANMLKTAENEQEQEA